MTLALEVLISAIINAVVTGMDIIGTSVLRILTMDIGGGNSMFELVFGVDTLNQFFHVFGIMSITILILNYGWQIVKIMYTAEGGTEGPVGLTIRTLIAGIFIYMVKDIVVVGESVFAVFYNFLLNYEDLNNVNFFANFYEDLKAVFIDQSENLADLLIIFIITYFLAKQYISYLVEVVERYVVLGVLVFTSPMAVSTAGSRATSNIFSSWVRMVISQLFLMVCNVIFMRMFLFGFTNYHSAIAEMQTKLNIDAGDTTTVTLLWGLLLYGVLEVGQRVDSYLGTLGLSVAQTGRGMMASLTQTAQSLRRAASTAMDIGKGAAKFHNQRSEARQKQAAAEKAAYKDTHRPVKKDANNAVDKDTFKAAAENKIDKNEISKTGGTSWTNGFMSRSEGLSSDFNNSLDYGATSKLGDGGSFKMYGKPNKNGERAEYTVTPMDSIKDKESLAGKSGRVVRSNDKDWFVQNTSKSAAGKAEGDAMLFKDKAAESKLAKEGFKPIEGVAGAYERTTVDANGNKKYEQMLNAAMHTPNEGLQSQLTKPGEYGDSQFHKVSVPAGNENANQGKPAGGGAQGGNPASGGAGAPGGASGAGANIRAGASQSGANIPGGSSGAGSVPGGTSSPGTSGGGAGVPGGPADAGANIRAGAAGTGGTTPGSGSGTPGSVPGSVPGAGGNIPSSAPGAAGSGSPGSIPGAGSSMPGSVPSGAGAGPSPSIPGGGGASSAEVISGGAPRSSGPSGSSGGGASAGTSGGGSIPTPSGGMPGGGPNAGQGGSYGGSGGYAPGSAPQAWSDGSMSRIASMGGAEIVTRLPESSYAAMHASNPETRQAEMQRSFPQLDTSGMTNIVADSASGSISFEKNGQQYVAFSSAEQRLSASGNDYVSGPVEHITAANGADYSVAPINSAAYAEAVQSMPGGARSNPVASMITENTPGVYNAANGPTRIPESAYEGMHSSSAQSRVAAVREAFPDMSTRGMAKVHVDSASGAFSFERGGQQYVAFSSMESQISAIGNQISTGSIQQVKAANGATYTVAQVDRDAYQQYRDNAVSAGEKPQSLAAVFTTPTRAVFSTPKVAVVPEVTTNPFVNQQNDIGSVSFRRTGRSGGGSSGGGGSSRNRRSR